MAHKTRQCRCGEQFSRLSDLLAHKSIDCQLRGQRRLRSVSCYRCAQDIDINTTRTCSCGWTLPDHDGSNPLPKWQPLTKE